MLRGTAHVIAVDESSAHVCIGEWRPTASGKSQLCSKQSFKKPSPENLMTIGGCFERYTYRARYGER